MPLYSGRAGIERLELNDDQLAAKCESELARLELPPKVWIAFRLGAEDLQRLRNCMARVFADYVYFSVKDGANKADTSLQEGPE